CTTVNLHSAVLMVTRESSRRDLVSARGWNCCVPVPGPVVDKPLQASFDLGLGITVGEVARDRSLKLACEDAGRFGVGNGQRRGLTRVLAACAIEFERVGDFN